MHSIDGFKTKAFLIHSPDPRKCFVIINTYNLLHLAIKKIRVPFDRIQKPHRLPIMPFSLP